MFGTLTHLTPGIDDVLRCLTAGRRHVSFCCNWCLAEAGMWNGSLTAHRMPFSVSRSHDAIRIIHSNGIV